MKRINSSLQPQQEKPKNKENNDKRNRKGNGKNYSNMKRNLKRRMTKKEREDEIKKLTEWMWESEDSNLPMDKNTRKLENVSKTSYNSKRQKRIDLLNGVNDNSGNKYEKFTGLINKRNDCPLNCLLQCFNALPIRRNLLNGIKDSNSTVPQL